MSDGYVYDHAWDVERLRLAGLEMAVDPGTRAHLLRLGLAPGWRCLEVGAGGGAMATWMAEQVAPDGKVVATDLETEFVEAAARETPGLEVLRHDVTSEDLPTGFDVVHARWLVEWLPDKRAALRRMAAALRPGGVLLVEEPDFVTFDETAEPAALRRAMIASTQQLQVMCPVDPYYGRHLLDDVDTLGLADVEAEGRCPVVRGGSPPAAHFLLLTMEKLRDTIIATGAVTEQEYADAVAALQDPTVTMVMPMTVAAWGRRR